MQALRAGFRCFDTAAQPRHYREELVGEGLRRGLVVERRDDDGVVDDDGDGGDDDGNGNADRQRQRQRDKVEDREEGKGGLRREDLYVCMDF